MMSMKPTQIKLLLKAKYIKRTGSPGHYRYVYQESRSARPSERYKTGTPGHYRIAAERAAKDKPVTGVSREEWNSVEKLGDRINSMTDELAQEQRHGTGSPEASAIEWRIRVMEARLASLKTKAESKEG